MDKWDYIDKINSLNNAYGTLLFEILLKYKKASLTQLTKEECREYYNSLLSKLYT